MNNFPKKYKKAHFVGIGGIGVSALAQYFQSEGVTVSGSDLSDCSNLIDKKIQIYKKHSPLNIKKDTDVVIYSNAITENNPEIIKAKKQNIKVMSYPEALGEVTKNYFTIAVSGTHGKSTTTAMISSVMIKSGLDPTVIIGTKIKSFINQNFRKGKSNYLLIEADEYKSALLHYYPKIAVINNIEKDHLDYYNSLNDIIKTFEKYIVENVKKNVLVVNKDDNNIKKILKAYPKKPVFYSLSDKKAKELKLSVPGEHNIYNALATLAVAKKLKIDEKTAINTVQKFKGTWRRFEEKNIKIKKNVTIKVINDYAHHPTAVKATIKAAEEKYQKKKIFLVFQPHQYNRTYHLLKDFQKSLSDNSLQKIIITDIYSVKGRESATMKKKVNSKMLTKGVKNGVYIKSKEKLYKYLLANLQNKNILIILGAGDIYLLEDKLNIDSSN